MKNRFEFFLSQPILVLISVAVSASASLWVYIYYFQRFGLSLYRLIAAVIIIGFLACLVFLSLRFFLWSFFENNNKQILKTLGFWAVVSALFVPYLFPTPNYPTSPLFQKTSNLEVRVSFPEDEDGEVQLKGVWLAFDDRKFSYLDFKASEEWTVRSERYFIDSSLQGSLFWKGKIGERAKLTVFPMDKEANVTVLWDGVESSSSLVDKPVSFSKKNETPSWYYILFVLAQFIVICFSFFLFFTLFESIERLNEKRAVIYLFLLSSSVLLVYAHFQSDDITNRFDLQIGYHQGVLAGNAPSPWQYRVFSEWVLAGIISLLKPLGYEQAFYSASLFIRIIQNILIYSMSFYYFQKLNFTDSMSLIGTIFLGGSLLNSYYNTGFSLNTYNDVIVYLGAVILILNHSFVWLPFLMIVGALNRETSGVVPFLALSALPQVGSRKSAVIFSGLAFFIWVIIFISLRLNYPPREIFVPYGNQPGIPLLVFNLFPPAFFTFFRSFSVIPILGMVVWRRWPAYLKRFFIILVPIWVFVHLVASVISETRLFLVPYLLIFLPAFLLFLENVANKMHPPICSGINRRD